MKDLSRRHTPSPRPAPYRKPKHSASPIYLAHGRAHERDASRDHIRVSGRARDPRPISPDQAIASSRIRDHERPTPSNQPDDDDRRSRSKTGGKPAASRPRKPSMTNPAPSQRAQSSCSFSLSTHAEVPGPPLRVHLAPVTLVPITDTPSAQITGRKTPSPESVDSFLRSIKLPDKPSCTSTPIPRPEPSPGLASHSSRPPTSRTETVQKYTPKPASGGENGSTSTPEHQVSLVYKGFSFSYDLSTLSDDPTGTIALLRITNSDPGAYILVGAHYRRTGRSRAACAVIRSLLARLDTPDGPSKSDVEKGKGNSRSLVHRKAFDFRLYAFLAQPSSSESSPQTTESPVDLTKSVFKGAAIRPVILLLAACEMDISREDPKSPESVRHAAKAHDLFRAVYGTVNDGIIAGAARSPAQLQPQNALGLEFSNNRSCVTSPGGPPTPAVPPASTPGPPPPPPPPPPEAESVKRIKFLERELDAARDSQKRLQDKLASTNNRLMRTEDKACTFERRLHDTRVQLDASREENLTLRQRLVEAERRASEPMNGAESRVWGKLKDLFFDNLGGGTRGE